jgi:hypothetical protein
LCGKLPHGGFYCGCVDGANIHCGLGSGSTGTGCDQRGSNCYYQGSLPQGFSYKHKFTSMELRSYVMQKTLGIHVSCIIILHSSMHSSM